MAVSVTEMYLIACLSVDCAGQPVVGAVALDRVTLRATAEGLEWTFDVDRPDRVGRCPRGHIRDIRVVAAALPERQPGRYRC